MKTESKTPRPARDGRQPLRTLLVDDSALILSCLQHFLRAETIVRVVGTAANGLEALERAMALAPDLVLMDLHMPQMDGLQAASCLCRRLPSARIIIMSLAEPVTAQACARAHGAHGFVEKGRIIEALMPEIRRVFRLKKIAGREGLS
jgi:two-component system, NarL family, nitrate/nitrite response regulator NarL